MNRAMRDLFRRELERMRSRIVDDLRQIACESPYEGAGHVRPSDVPGDTGDVAAGRSWEQVNIALMENEGGLLACVDAAIKRLEDGRFGLCQRCCEAIPAARLRAAPYTPWCHRCAMAQETPRTGFDS